MGYFVFRIDQVKIFKNRDIGKAEIQFLSFVTTDDPASLPNLTGLTETTDETRQIEIIKRAASQVAQSRVFTMVENVWNNHKFFFGDTGFALYTAGRIPRELHWCFVAMGDDRDVNRIGDYIDQCINNEDFSTLTGSIVSLASNSVPQARLVFEIAKFITGQVVKLMRENRDDQVGLLYQSWNRAEHYPHGTRTKNDAHDLTGNMRIDYTMFGMD